MLDAMNIVTISGTGRPENYTSRALGVVNDELTKQGREPQVFDAREMKLSFPGEPSTDDAAALIKAVTDAAGIVIATPEYHGSPAAMTKLIIENLGFPSALEGKAVGLVGVAAGRIGAIKSLEMLRGICTHTGAVVMPSVLSIAAVRNAFDDSGPTDPGTEDALRRFAGSFLGFIGDYVCPKYILEHQVRTDATPWSASI